MGAAANAGALVAGSNPVSGPGRPLTASRCSLPDRARLLGREGRLARASAFDLEEGGDFDCDPEGQRVGPDREA